MGMNPRSQSESELEHSDDSESDDYNSWWTFGLGRLVPAECNPTQCPGPRKPCCEVDDSEIRVHGPRYARNDEFEEVLEGRKFEDWSSLSPGRPQHSFWPETGQSRTLPWAEPDGIPVPSSSHYSKAHGSSAGGGAVSSTVSGLQCRARSPVSRISPVTGFMTLVFPACEYLVDASDPIDVEVLHQILSLDKEASAALMLRRLRPGIYEIDERIVKLAWAGPGGGQLSSTEYAEGLGGTGSDPIPFKVYMQQAADIAKRLVPMAPRTLTFEDKGVETTKADSCVGMQRYHYMQVACEQARVREETAQAYRRPDARGPLHRS